jgi:siderophore synthetase component
VHPLTARRIEDRPDAVLAPGTFLCVSPTLSVRTVATSHGMHLKLPIPVSTLGLRNRRLLPSGTLADGALVQRLLAAIAAPGGRTGGRVLLADEQTYACTADPMLGFMLRGFPEEVGDRSIVPVAALLAPDPDGGHVIERWGVEALFDAYLQALFEWNVRLFVRYGIALEAHQQNVALVLDEPPPHPGALHKGPLTLLLKDNDAALIDLDRLCAALGPATERPRFHDPRLVTTDQEALARVFVTITVHLCAGAVAFGLAGLGLLPLRTGLGLVRDRLDEALGRYGPEAAFLRRRTLDADRLPGKAMITAGTLVDKARAGAADINKHYGPPGPNYLRDHLCS